MRLYIGLVHYPVYNKRFDRIASAVTTVDLHDIARVGRTYEVKRFFVITPLDDQLRIAERVRQHWVEGHGARYNRHRKEALERMVLERSLESAVDTIAGMEGRPPVMVATDARGREGKDISYDGVRRLLHDGSIVFLLFGTAWGLDEEVLVRADYLLEPVSGSSDYNHLSVRSAAAIIIDRLVGRESMQ